MGQQTNITWTDHTFNIVWGCTKVSPGCAHCYAEKLALRYGHDVWGPYTPRRVLSWPNWKLPLRWNAAAKREGLRHRVFCGSMCDVFEDHPTVERERARLWPLIRETPWLDWQLLTKRPERIGDSRPTDWGDGWPNVWLGTSIESNEYAWRAEELVKVPAVVRFVSYEPALGPLDQLDLDGISWLIYGGESGTNFRQDDPQWARDIRDRCRENGTQFFFKQRAAYMAGQGDLDGELIREFPCPK